MTLLPVWNPAELHAPLDPFFFFFRAGMTSLPVMCGRDFIDFPCLGSVDDAVSFPRVYQTYQALRWLS